MLMHADYFSVMHSTIRVFSNRIVFQNPGRFIINISELFKSAVSHPRNPVIARFFRWAKLAENAGFGFDKMMAWKHKVDFETFVDYSEVLFYLGGQTEKEDVSEKVTENSIERLPEKVTEKVTENQQIILDEMANDPTISAENLSSILKISLRKTKVNIAKLKAKGLIERIGPAKGGYWRVIDIKK